MSGGEWGPGRRVKGMMGCWVGGRAKGRVRGGVEDKAVRGGGGVRWEEAKMACEITSDAILPI